MKIIDERETQKQTKKAKKQTKAEKNKGGGWCKSYKERVRAK